MGQHQHRIGPVDRVAVTVDSTAASNGVNGADFGIAIGDLVAKDATNGYVGPVNFTWDTDLATTRADFVAAFVGVSLDRVRSGKPSEFYEDPAELTPTIAQDGTFDAYLGDGFTGTITLGMLLGPKKHATNDTLINDVEDVTTNEAQAVFVALEDKVIATGDTPVVRARLVNTTPKRVQA